MNQKPWDKRMHYFFRFGTGGKIFKAHYREQLENGECGQLKIRVGSKVEIATYYDNFAAKDLIAWRKDIKASPAHPLLRKLSSNAKTSIREFIVAPKGSIFWIFDQDDLLAFEAVDDAVHDNTKFDDIHLDKQGKEKARTLAKARFFKCLRIVKRWEVPDIFATTDSSGFQGTVLALRSPSKRANLEIAEAIVSGEPLVVSDNLSLLDYLSPIQLETFFFKFFDSAGYHVSGYRGASKRKVDLQIRRLEADLSSKCGPFNVGEKTELQIKRTYHGDRAYVQSYLSEEIYFVTLSELREPWKLSDPFLIDREALGDVVASRDAACAIEWARASLMYEYISAQPLTRKKSA